MIIHSNIKKIIQTELAQAKSVWIASAMISHHGWKFLQTNLSKAATQNYLIGIDLSTDPKVFEAILTDLKISARIYETQFTFHPKVYLIQRANNSFTCFIGSSNTTNWGLEKNVEMNYQINDLTECEKILIWFKELYSKGYLITQPFIEDYKIRFAKTSFKIKEIEKEIDSIKEKVSKDKGQFFSANEHEIFNIKYHRLDNPDLKLLRKEVRDKFLQLHQNIFPKFESYGLNDLHHHHQSREIVSRHFFNQFSGNYINAIWLHYGKSLDQLQKYSNGDKSINKPDSFINNIRMQVIIHENSIGIWLVLGRNNGSLKDRKSFRQKMTDKIFRTNFFNAFKNLGDEYWINTPDETFMKGIKTPEDLLIETNKETIDEYFIIGNNINYLSLKLSKESISLTVLEEFKKLYPLYEMMKDR